MGEIKNKIILPDHLQIHPTAFVSPGAFVSGEVILEEYSSVWPGAVVRGDMGLIHIGRRTNVQDNAVLHVDFGFPTLLGENVVVGHHAIIHGAKIQKNCLIAIGAILLNGVEIGEGSIIGAGALIPEGKKIPPRSIVFGIPGKILDRKTTDQQIEEIIENAQVYVDYAAAYLKKQS